ncbi:MAG: hypothetical protein WDZ59_01395 [Pirellulales bacterium]
MNQTQALFETVRNVTNCPIVAEVIAAEAIAEHNPDDLDIECFKIGIQKARRWCRDHGRPTTSHVEALRRIEALASVWDVPAEAVRLIRSTVADALGPPL